MSNQNESQMVESTALQLQDSIISTDNVTNQ